METTNKSRELLLFNAKLSEQAERYQDMVKDMKQVVIMGGELNEEERNLLSVAYKNVVGASRAAWRVIKSIEPKVQNNEDHLKELELYRKKIENELQDVCNDMLDLCSKYLIATATEPESQVFYYKMKADYLRYLAEVKSVDERKEIADQALAVYTQAHDICKNSLCPTNPIRLGLNLNFSVFYYEIMNLPDQARDLAKGAFDAAIGRIDTLPDDHRKDSTMIMQLLRDNLTIWTSDYQQEQVQGDYE